MRRNFTSKLGLLTGLIPAVILGIQPATASPQSQIDRNNQSLATEAPKVASRSNEPTSVLLDNLIDQLGAPKFAQRQAASRALESYGLVARSHLVEALSHPDAEVRAGAEDCLNAILDGDRNARFEIARENPGRLDEVQLPGWERFRAMIGSDAASRELFLEIFAEEPQLIESAESGGAAAVESLTARCLQLRAYQQLPIEKGDREATFASVAALMFVGTDASAKLPPQVLTNVMSHLNKSAFQSRLRDRNSPAIRRLLAAWVYQTGDSPITYQNLLLAARYDAKEVIPAAKKLADDTAASPESRMYGILVVGKLGGKDHARWMTQFLEDESVCSAYAYLREGSRGRYETQLRDVALATLIHVTGQDHNSYGFRRLRGHSQILFNTSSIGFAVGEPDREKAILRWKSWEEEHPLPETPLVAPPSTISAYGYSFLAQDVTSDDGFATPDLRIAQVAGGLPEANAAAPPRAGQNVKGQLPAVAPTPGNPSGLEDDESNVAALGNLPHFYLTDRQVRVWLTRAEENAAAGEYVDAAKYLDAALNSPLANSYQRDRLTPIHVGIRAEAERLLANLPEKGMAVYESYVGSTAERQLQAAVQSQNALAVADVARRYFYTIAGAKAELLWGVHLYDTGQPMAAAAAFARVKNHPHGRQHEPDLSFRLTAALTKAGFPGKAEEIIALAASPPRGTAFVVGNQRYTLGVQTPFTPSAFVPWLTGAIDREAPQWAVGDWPIFGGDPSRNRFVDGERPLLRARWSVETVSQAEIQSALMDLTRAYADQRRAAVPGAHPIAVNDTIIARTPAGLLAVNIADGTTSWRVEFDAALEARLINELKHGNKHLLYRELDERMWGDAASGRISSDGQRVYAIDNSGQVGHALSQKMTITRRGSRRLEPRWHHDRNQLVAYDLATEGKTVWTLGGPAEESTATLEGAYFLGPPLPLGGQLYVLIERDQMVQLLALDAEHGSVLRTLTLASLDPGESEFLGSANSSVKSATRHAQRRSGSMPAYQDGILVCPTSDGGFASVDLSQNEVIWTYRATPRYLKEAFKVWQAADEETTPIDPSEPRLLDGEVLISGQNVLVAPLEMSALLCLDLQTGDVRWERPLHDLRFIATASKGTVLLVGRSSIRGIDLQTGKHKWPGLTLPAGSAPSGRGFASGDKYFLPLSTAELVVVDIHSGRIESRLMSHEPQAPGNLICVQDYVVSQSVERLEIFEQLSFAISQAKAELENSGPTAEALQRYGETLMYAGDYVSACEQLHAAFQQNPNPQTLELLCAALLEALALDYERFQPLAADVMSAHLDSLDVEVRRQFIRRRAEHAEQQGHIVDAFEAIVELIDLPDQRGDVIARGPTLDTSELAWLSGQLKRLREQASYSELSEINARVVEIYDAIPDEPSMIVRFARLFPKHPLADTCYLRLLDEFSLSDPLEQQWAILNLEQSRREDIQRDALIRQFHLLVNNGRLMEAAHLSNALHRDCRNPIERDEINQIVGARFIDNQLWKPEDSKFPRWPIHSKQETASEERAPYGRRYVLELDGARNAFQNDLELEIRSDAQSIVARNFHGIKRWEADLRGSSDDPLLPMNPEAVRIRQVGHVLIVWRGHEVLALDLMTPPTAEARILWKKSLVVSFPGRPVDSGVIVRAIARPGALPRLKAFNRTGTPLGELGPVNRNYVAFLRGHTLEAVSPLTGEVLWRRHDVASGSQLFGDEEYMVYVEPDCRVAVVLQAEDGREVGHALAPAAETWVSTAGRRIVSWHEDNGAQLTIVDPAEAAAEADGKLVMAKVIYQRQFAAGACVYRVGTDEVAACDPAGKFTIVRCEDGRVIANETLPAQPKMNALYVTRSPEEYVVIVSGPTETTDTVFPVPGGYRCPLVHGTAFGFDRPSGKLMWNTAIENQSVDLTQPEYLPILTFACRALPPVDATNKARRYESRVFCLDKRTGRVLIDDHIDGSINRVQLVPDFNQNTIEIRTTQDAYLLKFRHLHIGPMEKVLIAPYKRY